MTAWDIRAAEVARDHNQSMDDARNYVILEWLREGDTRAFCSWILRGHLPSPNVLRAIAVMMARADNAKFCPAGFDDPEMSEIAELFPLGLKVTRKGKRGRDLEIVERDKRAALEVAKEMARGSGYDRALDVVTSWLPKVGVHIERDAVEKAYKAHKPK